MRFSLSKIIALSLFVSTQLHAAPEIYKKNKRSQKGNRLLLSWTSNPQSSISIGFEPQGESKDNFLVYDTVSHKVEDPSSAYTYSVKARDSKFEDYCSRYSPNKFKYVRAELSQLKTSTKYYFRTYSAGAYSKEMYFVTGPRAEESFKLLSGGDSRSDRKQRVRMNKQLKNLLEEDSSYLALVHGGDFVSSGDSCTDWSEWLDDHQETIADDGRVLPIVPTFGNHENGGEELYRRLFPHPDYASRFYYNINFGLLDIVILNSEVSTEGDQKEFLSSSLAMLDKKQSFKIVGYHRPAFPAVKRPASTKSFVPLLEKYNVALVLESDGHSLKQTCPIRNDSCEKGGVIYVGEGGLGVKQRNAGKSYKWYFDGGYAISQHHVQSIEVDALNKTMTYQVYFDGRFRYPLNFSL